MVSRAFLFSGALVFRMLLLFLRGPPPTSAKPPVSRFSLTGARARMSLQSLHWWNAFSQGPNIPLSFCAWLPPRWFMGKEEKGRWVFLLYSFTWLFYELLYFSPPVFLSPPFLEVSFVGAEICVCSVVPEPWVIAFLVVCHYRDFCSQCVGVQKKKETNKHENSYPPCCGRSSREEVSPVGVIWMDCCLRGNGWGTRAMVQKGIVNLGGEKKKNWVSEGSKRDWLLTMPRYGGM